MAETFTLPEELFNSMINGFNDENKTEELNIEIDQNEKNKADGSNKTILNVTQKRRIANIANVLFDDNAKKFFETDFENHLKKIEDIELEQTKEAVNIIKEEAEEEVKEKKNKKKTSFKKRMRQFRMVSHLLKFITDIYNNFKKFGKESNSIIQRHFYDKGFSIRGVLTDKNERKLFIDEVFKAMEEIAYAFYYSILLETIQPTIEFFTKIILEKVLDFLDKISEALDAGEDALEKFGLTEAAKNEISEFSRQLKGKNLGKGAKTIISSTEKAVSKSKKVSKAAQIGKKALTVVRTAKKAAQTARYIKGAVTVTRIASASLKAAGIRFRRNWCWSNTGFSNDIS